MSKQNIGRDLSVAFNLGGNTIKQFGLHTDTHFRPQFTEVRSRPTNNGGIPVARAIYGGHEVELAFDRVNGVPMALSQFIEDNFVAGNSDIDVTLQITVRNSDGSVDQSVYSDGIMYPTDDGSYKGTEVVALTYKFFFARKS